MYILAQCDETVINLRAAYIDNILTSVVINPRLYTLAIHVHELAIWEPLRYFLL